MTFLSFPYLNGLPMSLWRLGALCLLALTVSAVSADEYVLDPSPMQPSGNKGEVPFEQPADSAVCGLYLENLRYFARRNVPLSCERPIAPHLKDRIQKVEWEDLNQADYPELFRAIAGKHGWNIDRPSEKLPARDISQAIRKTYVFRRAKLPFRGYPYYDEPDKPASVRQALWYVQFGSNTLDPQNPDPVSRCVPVRGGPPDEIFLNLKLYLVSEDMKTLFDRVYAVQNGGSGEALRIINRRPYVEAANTGGHITLMEIDRVYPGTLEPVCLFLFKRIDFKD